MLRRMAQPLRTRVRQYYTTPLGAAKPHKGGWWLKTLAVHVERVMGVLLVLTGIAFLTGFVTTASFWLLEAFPALGTIG